MSGFSFARNCSLGFEFYFCRPFQVDPDIAGVGVITNFIATAYITWALFLLNYILAYDPSKFTGAFADETNGEGSHFTWQPNPIDMHTVAWIRRVTGRRMHHPHMARIFDESILSMCDIQIMTGFALLLCGFILAFSSYEPLSSYHWFLIVCLAWFSAITHLAGLSVLRTYFDDRPRVKTARIVLMFLLLVALIVALIPTGFFNWREPKSVAAPQSPAICFFDVSTALRLWNEATDSPYDWHWQEITETPAMQQMVLAVILLGLGFTSRCIKLFQPLARTLRRGIRERAHICFAFMVERLALLLLRRPSKSKTLDSVANEDSFWNRLWKFTVFIPLLGLFLTGRLFADLIGSMLAEIIWVWCALVWGTVKFVVLAIDKPNQDYCENYSYRNDQRWTFGQMMAVALLATPIFSIIWKFGELAIQSQHDTIEQRRQRLNPDIEPGMHEASGAQPLPETQYRDQQAVTVPTGLSDANVYADGVSRILARDYYSTAPWIWPVIVQSYFPLLGATGLALCYANAAGHMSMTEFWLTGFRILPYLLLGFPAACAATMIAGLALDQWYSHGSGWKWNLIFWTGLCIHAIYFLAFFNFYGSFFGALPAPYAILPCSLYTIYGFCGSLGIFGKDIKSCLLTRGTVH